MKIGQRPISYDYEVACALYLARDAVCFSVMRTPTPYADRFRGHPAPVGSEDWTSVMEIADIVVRAMGLFGVKYKFRPMTPDGRGWPGDVKLMLLDISKLKGTGWRPSMGSREAVEKTVKKLVSEGAR